MGNLTREAVRLGLSGLVAGTVTGLAWRFAGRRRWGPVPFTIAVLAAALHADRSDWPRWEATAAAGAVVIVLAGFGTRYLLAEWAVDWRWVAAGSLVSMSGVWAGVPETGPALLAGGALTGLTLAALVTRSRWAPAAGAGLGALLGWAALSGAAGRPWAAVGGALCAGVAPSFAFRPLLLAPIGIREAGPWLLGVHTVLVLLSARWIGVDPQAGWNRAAVVVAAGLFLAGATRRRA